MNPTIQTPNATPEIEGIIRKIQRMFAMAQGNHSEAEVELMMIRAQEKGQHHA